MEAEDLNKARRKAIFNEISVAKVVAMFTTLTAYMREQEEPDKEAELTYKGVPPWEDTDKITLYVSPRQKIWKDFSHSFYGGNAIIFVMRAKDLSEEEAMDWIEENRDEIMAKELPEIV